MGTSLLTTLTLGTIATTAAAATLLRRRISRNWLAVSSPSALTTINNNNNNNNNDNKNTNYNQKLLTPQHICIITGGNTGLGYETARNLAKRGGTIVLACRNIESGERAARNIRRDTGNERVSARELDLASLDSVRNFAKGFGGADKAASAVTITANNDCNNTHRPGEEGGGIYALICNAGVWMPMEQKAKTQDGYEIHFGINHLGHFLLIQNMIPHMQKTSGIKGSSRIVIVSSSLLKSGKVDLKSREFVYCGRGNRDGVATTMKDDDLTIKEKKGKNNSSFAPTGYCDSKLMNTLTCRQLALHLEGTNITTYAVSPGFCRSQLGRHVHMPFYKKMLLWPIFRVIQRSPVQGAENIIFATMEDESKMVNGAMYQDGKVAEEETRFVDGLGEEVQKGLWELSQELVTDKNE